MNVTDRAKELAKTALLLVLAEGGADPEDADLCTAIKSAVEIAVETFALEVKAELIDNLKFLDLS